MGYKRTNVVSSVRHISATAHTSRWYHTTLSPRKDVYERFATQVGTGRLLRSTVMRQKRGVFSWKEVYCQFRLFPDAFIREDTDVILAGLLLFITPRDWKSHQTQLTRKQLESCIAVSQLRMDQPKIDDNFGLTGCESEILA